MSAVRSRRRGVVERADSTSAAVRLRFPRNQDRGLSKTYRKGPGCSRRFLRRLCNNT